MATVTKAEPKAKLDGKEVVMTAKDVEIVREGTKIVLPPGMSYEEGIVWLQRKREHDEKEVSVLELIPYFPTDALVALNSALAEKFGYTNAIGTPGFWGDNPPLMIGVPTGPNPEDVVQVPWGKIQIPGIVGYIQTGVKWDPVPQFQLTGTVKQKNLPDVREIVAMTHRRLREKSIYKGKSLRIDYEWQRNGDHFDPLEHAPKFWDNGGKTEADLVFPRVVSETLRIGLFAPIRHPEAFRANKIPLKRGVLLYGPYGTGKTLTAAVTAAEAERNGWTFLYLNSVDDFVQGLRLAKQYAPSVVFVEDIDRLSESEDPQERTRDIDRMLNNLDGVDTKNSEIVTVMTTNNLSGINAAMLRPGRVDVMVELLPPDAEGAERLVRMYGRKLFHPDADLREAGRVLDGRIPALIRETVERAKIRAIDRTGSGDIHGLVLSEDVVAAAVAMEHHASVLNKPLKKERRFSFEDLAVVAPNGDGNE